MVELRFEVLVFLLIEHFKDCQRLKYPITSKPQHYLDDFPF